MFRNIVTSVLEHCFEILRQFSKIFWNTFKSVPGYFSKVFRNNSKKCSEHCSETLRWFSKVFWDISKCVSEQFKKCSALFSKEFRNISIMFHYHKCFGTLFRNVNMVNIFKSNPKQFIKFRNISIVFRNVSKSVPELFFKSVTV